MQNPELIDEGNGLPGVTRERLESFDRAITLEPADYPDKRDTLIGEFRTYLGILKARHGPPHAAWAAIISICKLFNVRWQNIASQNQNQSHAVTFLKSCATLRAQVDCEKKGQSQLRVMATRMQAVHSGADLNASAKAAAGALPGVVKGYLGYVQAHQGDHIILPLVENAVEARTELGGSLSGNRCGQRACLGFGDQWRTSSIMSKPCVRVRGY